MEALFSGCMQGRTMYVIPYCMGPIDSPLSRCGVEITDSAYVVANMRMMPRMGQAALARIEREGSFVRGLHSIGELDPDRLDNIGVGLDDEDLHPGPRRRWRRQVL